MYRAPRAVRCPLLIGRDDLLDLADRRIEDVLAGHGQFLLLAGQAGIGKTRFLGAIQRKAESRGFATADGAVAPQDCDVPAASILDMARSMVRLAPFATLGRQVLGLDRAILESGHAHRRRLVMETVELVLASLPGPTMLSFWDLQWADDVSLEIIAELARRSRDRPLLLTGDYRTEDVPPGTSLRAWRARLITQRIAEEVRLDPLDAAETALVTTLILDTGLPAPRDVAAAVYERTDGIPLHIEELLGALSAEARTDGTAIREATVPDTIEEAVIARIARLSPEAQAAARAGAVIGRCFVPDVLAGIMDLPPTELEAPLQELVDEFILDPPGLRGLYDFRHQLLRDALYRTIPASERRRFHARAGEFGARLEGDPVEAQLRASQSIVDKGCRRGVTMARWARGYVLLSQGALDEASAELEEALEFGMGSEEIELILPPMWGLAEVALQAGEPDRAFAICRDALARAAAVGEWIRVAPFVATGVRAAQQAGRPAEAATWLESCAALLASRRDVAGAALDHGRGLVALADGATGVARVALESAVAGWDRHGRAWESTWARLDLAHCLVRSTRFAEAVTLAVEARTAAGRLESGLLADRADELLRMARGHVSDHEPWRPLTSREFEVARLIGEGLTNAEIAESLGIAPRTASSHVEHILAKLGASRRAEIATWASHVQSRPPQHRGQPVEPATRV